MPYVRKLIAMLLSLPRNRWGMAITFLVGGVVALLLTGLRSPNAADSSGFLSGNWWRFLIQAGGSEGEEGQNELEEREIYWATRRGLQFGVPRDAYRAATGPRYSRRFSDGTSWALSRCWATCRTLAARSPGRC
jgi:hypothetical protein